MNVQQLFAANVGKSVETAAGVMKIDSLLEKMGTLKSGDKAPYLHLSGDNGQMELHPEKAKTLLTKGELGAMKILGDIAAPSADGAALIAEAINSTGLGNTTVEEVKDAMDRVGAEAAAAAEAEAPAEKKESKKDATLRIYREGQAAKLARKDIIARMRTELNMSVPGANTYYQNCKSGHWK